MRSTRDLPPVRQEGSGRARAIAGPVRPALRAVPTGREDIPLLRFAVPSRTFHDLALRDELAFLLLEVVREHQHSELLGAHGFAPRRRLLFVGPPGCGKSVTAEALAAELNYPIARVHLASVVSSYLGETARNLNAIFDFA